MRNHLLAIFTKRFFFFSLLIHNIYNSLNNSSSGTNCVLYNSCYFFLSSLLLLYFIQKEKQKNVFIKHLKQRFLHTNTYIQNNIYFEFISFSCVFLRQLNSFTYYIMCYFPYIFLFDPRLIYYLTDFIVLFSFEF